VESGAFTPFTHPPCQARTKAQRPGLLPVPTLASCRARSWAGRRVPSMCVAALLPPQSPAFLAMGDTVLTLYLGLPSPPHLGS
jgi:hypothetical protein